MANDLPVADAGAVDAGADAVGHSYLAVEHHSHFLEPAAVAVAAVAVVVAVAVGHSYHSYLVVVVDTHFYCSTNPYCFHFVDSFCSIHRLKNCFRYYSVFR